MDTSQVRERFERTVQLSDDQIDLAEACLLIAAEADPSLNIPMILSELDRLAIKSRPYVDLEKTTVGCANDFCHLLYKVLGFQGVQENYKDPSNSFLQNVIASRRGIPISLAAVYIAIGNRLGVHVTGVNFPFHFLVRFSKHRGSDQAVLIDPFVGEILSINDCEGLLKQWSNTNLLLMKEHLGTATNKDILKRLLSNLKNLYTAEGDYEAALSCCDRLLLLDPANLLDMQDRAIILERLGCVGAAIFDLEKILLMKPRGRSAGDIRSKIQLLQNRGAESVH